MGRLVKFMVAIALLAAAAALLGVWRLLDMWIDHRARVRRAELKRLKKRADWLAANQEITNHLFDTIYQAAELWKDAESPLATRIRLEMVDAREKILKLDV